jgi:hypothetical protein
MLFPSRVLACRFSIEAEGNTVSGARLVVVMRMALIRRRKSAGMKKRKRGST